MTEPKLAPAHLEIHSRTSTDGQPYGHTVDCPNKGWISLVQCLECQELAELQFDAKTNTTFVSCTPAAK